MITIKCNKSYYGLTYNKEYIVEEEGYTYYTIINDNNIKKEYSKNFFIILKK